MHSFLSLLVLSVPLWFLAAAAESQYARSLSGASAHRRHALHALNVTTRNGQSDVVWGAGEVLQRRGGSAFTVFAPGPGACGGHNADSDFIVALNDAQWDNGAHCYKKITITYNGKTVPAQIVDECPGCQPGGLDLSPAVFKSFADIGVGMIYGSWSYGDGGDPEPKSSSEPSPTPSAKPKPSPTPTSSKEQPASTTSALAPATTEPASSTTSSSISVQTSSTPTSSSNASPTVTLSPNDPQFLNEINILMLRLESIVNAGAFL